MSTVINLFKRSPALVYVVTLLVSISIVFSIYYFQATFVAKFPFWSWAVFAPMVLGLSIGYSFGTIINQSFERERLYDLRKSLEKKEILNQILIKSKGTNDLLEFLNGVLEIITDTDIARIKAEAGILLKGQDGRYRMVSSLNLDTEIEIKCANEGIVEGECLCGIALQNKEVIYTDSVDERHTVSYEGMVDHGHYILPIIHKGTKLGVLSFHLDQGHKYNTFEVDFLTSVADILALVINNYQSEQKDRVSQIVISSAKRIVGLASWQVVFPVRKAYWSDELYEMLGYNRREVTLDKKFLSKILHPAEKDMYFKLLRQAELGKPFEVELRLIDKEGKTKHVVNKCTPNYGVDGKIDRLHGTIFNLTEIHEKQEALIEKEAFIESIASDSPYAMFLIDIVDNKLLFTNRMFNKIVDDTILDNLEIKGIEALEPYLHKDDLAQFRDTYKQVLKGDKEFYRLIARIAYDGVNYRWVNQRFKPFKKTADNKVSQILMVAIDIDRQKEAEEVTKGLNKKLILQNKKLQKLNNELDNFIYSASHDMRAPLSSVLGLLNLYKKDTDDSTRDIYLKHIESSVIKLDEFIHEIVDFSRNKKTQLAPVRIHVIDFLNNLYTHLKYINPGNEIPFEINTNGVDEIIADQERLGIVLQNIFTNAILYANSNVSSFIKCELDKTETHYYIRINDNGIGVSPAHLDRVFDMFHRATERSTGSGLGLYIAKETVTMLGGELSITSEEYKGTELEIKLPIQASKVINKLKDMPATK